MDATTIVNRLEAYKLVDFMITAHLMGDIKSMVIMINSESINPDNEFISFDTLHDVCILLVKRSHEDMRNYVLTQKSTCGEELSKTTIGASHLKEAKALATSKVTRRDVVLVLQNTLGRVLAIRPAQDKQWITY